MGLTSYTGQSADESRIRNGMRTAVMLFVYEGVESGSPATNITWGSLLRDGQTVSTIAPERVNERDINEFGYTQAKISDGVKVGDFNVAFQGNAQEAIWAIQSINGDVQVAIDPSVSKDNFGMLMFLSVNEDSELEACHVVPWLSCKEAPTPGVEAGGETTQELTFFANEYLGGFLRKGMIWFVDGWYDNGVSITNADAPDGVDTTFVLGTGNGSSYVYQANDAEVIDNTQSDYRKYIKHIVLVESGVAPRIVQPDEIASFAVATGTLTFVTAPPALSKLFVVWACEESIQPAYYAVTNNWREHYGF